MNARIIVSRTNEKPILRGFSVVPWSENCACNEGTALQYPERFYERAVKKKVLPSRSPAMD